MPDFIAWTIFGGITLNWLGEGGMINQLMMGLGLQEREILYNSDAKYFWWITYFTDVLKETGWSAIIYIAAISGIDPAVYHWNDDYQGVIYIYSQHKLSLQTMLFKIVAENSMSFMQQQAMAQFGAKLPGNSIKFASMMVATLPILMFYPLNQFYYEYKCSYRNSQDLNEAIRYIHESYHRPLDLAMVSNRK